ERGAARIEPDATPVPYPFDSGAELLAHTQKSGLPISGVMMANEVVRRDEAAVRAGLLRIWRVMQECVEAGSQADGVLPGGLKVRRRGKGPRGKPGRTRGPAQPPVRPGGGTPFRRPRHEPDATGRAVVTPPDH